MDRFHRADQSRPIPSMLYTFTWKIACKAFSRQQKSILLKILSALPGVFESYAVVIERSKGNPFDLEKTKHYAFHRAELLELIEKIILSTHQQRLEIAGIIPIRIDMIVTASLLTVYY